MEGGEGVSPYLPRTIAHENLAALWRREGVNVRGRDKMREREGGVKRGEGNFEKCQNEKEMESKR